MGISREIGEAVTHGTCFMMRNLPQTGSYDPEMCDVFGTDVPPVLWYYGKAWLYRCPEQVARLAAHLTEVVIPEGGTCGTPFQSSYPLFRVLDREFNIGVPEGKC